MSLLDVLHAAGIRTAGLVAIRFPAAGFCELDYVWYPPTYDEWPADLDLDAYNDGRCPWLPTATFNGKTVFLGPNAGLVDANTSRRLPPDRVGSDERDVLHAVGIEPESHTNVVGCECQPDAADVFLTDLGEDVAADVQLEEIVAGLAHGASSRSDGVAASDGTRENDTGAGVPPVPGAGVNHRCCHLTPDDVTGLIAGVDHTVRTWLVNRPSVQPAADRLALRVARDDARVLNREVDAIARAIADIVAGESVLPSPSTIEAYWIVRDRAESANAHFRSLADEARHTSDARAES